MNAYQTAGVVTSIATAAVTAVWLTFVIRELFERRPTDDLAEMKVGQYLTTVIRTLWIWGVDDTLRTETGRAQPVMFRRLHRILIYALPGIALSITTLVLTHLGGTL